MATSTKDPARGVANGTLSIDERYLPSRTVTQSGRAERSPQWDGAGVRLRRTRQPSRAAGSLLDSLNTNVTKMAGAQLRQGSRLDQIEDRLNRVDGELAEHGTALAEHGAKRDRLIELVEQRGS